MADHSDPTSDIERGSTRRTVVKGAAWTVPAIVVMTAAPAFAASGPALVTTAVSAVVTGNVVRVTVTLTNANTGSTGAMTLALNALPTLGSVNQANPTIVTASSTSGWSFDNRANAGTGQTFNFSRPTGIVGASTPTGTSVVTLTVEFGISKATGQTSGTLTASPAVTTGSATPGSGLWA